jgi:hypothetical protein
MAVSAPEYVFTREDAGWMDPLRLILDSASSQQLWQLALRSFGPVIQQLTHPYLMPLFLPLDAQAGRRAHLLGRELKVMVSGLYYSPSWEVCFGTVRLKINLTGQVIPHIIIASKVPNFQLPNNLNDVANIVLPREIMVRGRVGAWRRPDLPLRDLSKKGPVRTRPRTILPKSSGGCILVESTPVTKGEFTIQPSAASQELVPPGYPTPSQKSDALARYDISNDNLNRVKDPRLDRPFIPPGRSVGFCLDSVESRPAAPSIHDAEGLRQAYHDYSPESTIPQTAQADYLPHDMDGPDSAGPDSAGPDGPGGPGGPDDDGSEYRSQTEGFVVDLTRAKKFSQPEKPDPELDGSIAQYAIGDLYKGQYEIKQGTRGGMYYVNEKGRRCYLNK